MTINLVHLLVGFLFFFLLAYGARLMIRYFGAPQPVETIVMLILLIVFVVWILQEIGVTGPVIRIGNAAETGRELLLLG
jgi:hypothetical protein